MHETKQSKDNYKSLANSQTRDEVQTEESFLHQEDSLVQQLSGLGTIPQSSVQAQMLSRIPACQIATNPQLLLQIQERFGNSYVSQVVQMAGENTVQRFPGESAQENVRGNKTGLPENLKAGIENISGIAMDDVKVHYNSSKPSQFQAYAYTQGTEIHVGPGQEKHLPHEAWHVVQQKQGRVTETGQREGEAVNEEGRLEKEADEMGKKAIGAEQGRGELVSKVFWRGVTKNIKQMYVSQRTDYMGDEAKEARLSRIGNPARGRNICTAHLTDGSVIIGRSRPPALNVAPRHSEEEVVDEFRRRHMNNDELRVLWMYTEREPCGRGAGMRGCRYLLTTFLARWGNAHDNTVVYYSYDYGGDEDLDAVVRDLLHVEGQDEEGLRDMVRQWMSEDREVARENLRAWEEGYEREQ